MRSDNGGLAAEMRERRPVKPDGALCQLGGDTGEDSSGAEYSQAAFLDHRTAALTLLNGASRLTRKAGSFLGQLCVDPTPLSDAQLDWLQTLLDRAGLPPLSETGNG